MRESSLSGAIAEKLNGILEQLGQHPLELAIAMRFEAYCGLLLKWNARVNLTAIRDEDGILRRHFAESIACARILPAGIHSLLDLGSGAGFPGIPIALCRPEIAVTLAESQGKKAAFLREVLRTVEIRAEVHGNRAETLGRRFDCVTLRAVDRMESAVRTAAELVHQDGHLALLCTSGSLDKLKEIAVPGYAWQDPIGLPGGEERILALGRRTT